MDQDVLTIRKEVEADLSNLPVICQLFSVFLCPFCLYAAVVQAVDMKLAQLGLISFDELCTILGCGAVVHSLGGTKKNFAVPKFRNLGGGTARNSLFLGTKQLNIE